MKVTTKQVVTEILIEDDHNNALSLAVDVEEGMLEDYAVDGELYALRGMDTSSLEDLLTMEDSDFNNLVEILKTARVEFNKNKQ